MKALKWDFEKNEYDEIEISDDACLIAWDMDEQITCPGCEKVIQFGDGYTSLQIHGRGGFGYTVCKECYRKELELEREARYHNATSN